MLMDDGGQCAGQVVATVEHLSAVLVMGLNRAAG